MKDFEEQNYPHTIRVAVQFNNAPVFQENIKGLNFGHALYLAKKNWPGAKIVFGLYTIH